MDLLVPRIITLRRPSRESIGRHPYVVKSHSLLLILREGLLIYHDVPACFTMTFEVATENSLFPSDGQVNISQGHQVLPQKREQGSSNFCRSVMNSLTRHEKYIINMPTCHI
jgi:hypothetical protein